MRNLYIKYPFELVQDCITSHLFSLQVFEEAMDLGFNPYLLDIGGGFPGSNCSSIDEFAQHINKALDEFFPEGSGVEVI